MQGKTYVQSHGNIGWLGDDFMKMSFLPGELHLTQAQDGAYVITMQGEEIFNTRSQNSAVTKFNKLRREMESQFPPHEFSPEEKRLLLQRLIGDTLVSHNGDRHRKNKHKSGSTRTFG
jgi:hypothetical protein